MCIPSTLTLRWAYLVMFARNQALAHFLAWRSPNAKSLNLQEKREPESKLIVNLCTLRSYEEYGKKSDNIHREKKTLLFTSIERSKYLFFFKQRT